MLATSGWDHAGHSIEAFELVPERAGLETGRGTAGINKARTNDFLANTAALSNNLGLATVNQAKGMGDVFLQIAADRIQATSKPTSVVDQLRTLVAIVNTGSYTEAAQDLNKSQSEVSKYMKQLEDQIGGPIFVRGASTMRLTVDGQRLLNYARAPTRHLARRHLTDFIL